MRRRFKQVVCALKEHSSVSFAKIATVGGFCDINLIIVKATSPDDLPLADKYIHQLLKIFTISSSSFHTFALSLSSRFSKTRSWRVGLKCLLLLHRLLRSVPECSPFRTQLLWSKSNALLSLYPCHFRDESSSNPECYTMFIRSYAQLLDEALECFCFEGIKDIEFDREGEVDVQEDVSSNNKMEDVGKLLQVLSHLQDLIDRVMDCRPTGAAARSFIVQSAMKYIIRDSFICYTTFRREVLLVLDNLIEMPYRSCVLAFNIYKKASLQADQLCEFYDWCRARVLCGAYEYPYIDKIPQIQIRALEAFLSGMWQLTDSSSSTTSPSSWLETKSSSTDDGDNRRLVVRKGYVISTEWEKFENGFPSKVEKKDHHHHDMASVIQFDDEDDWEALLDASLSLSFSGIPRKNMIMMYSSNFHNGYVSDGVCGDETEEKNQWQIQLYNPKNGLNPFY